MTDARRRILVIEDDSETADQLVETLASSGYSVDLAIDGDNGLALARGGDYAVMTIDRMIPGVDGLSIIRRLREGVRTEQRREDAGDRDLPVVEAVGELADLREREEHAEALRREQEPRADRQLAAHLLAVEREQELAAKRAEARE